MAICQKEETSIGVNDVDLIRCLLLCLASCESDDGQPQLTSSSVHSAVNVKQKHNCWITS